MFCSHCGREILDQAAVCIYCGVATGRGALGGNTKSRTAFVLLAIFVGGLGIHNFFAGYTGKGVAQLLITILTGWLIVPLVAVWIWALIEACTVRQDAQGVPFS